MIAGEMGSVTIFSGCPRESRVKSLSILLLPVENTKCFLPGLRPCLLMNRSELVEQEVPTG